MHDRYLQFDTLSEVRMSQGSSDPKLCPELTGSSPESSTRDMKIDEELNVGSDTGGRSFQGMLDKCRISIGIYFRKFRGGDAKRLPIPRSYQVGAANLRVHPLL